MKHTLAGLLLTLACLVDLPAQAQTILLRNLSMIERDSSEALITVNLLIKDSKLDVISQDLIPLGEADIAYDAQAGVVLGELRLGETANFMILDEDPRVNIDALLDTRQHTLFAIRRGKVLRNRLTTIISETQEEKKRASQGWLAYTPPPLAMPTDYRNTSKWNRFESTYVSGIGVAALMLDRQYWNGQDNDNKLQVGNVNNFEGGEIRALRIGGVGTINFEQPWVWALFAASNAFDKGYDSRDDDDWVIYDMRLDIPLWQKASFSIGKQKEPISMERLMTLPNLPQQERAASSDAFLPSRNVGVVMAGNLLDERMTLAGGLFNNWLDKDQPDNFSDNSSQFVSRITWVPWQSANESTLLHLGGAYRYSNARESARAKTEPEFDQSPVFVDTGPLEGDRYDIYQSELSLRSGPFWLHSEYLRTETSNGAIGDPGFSGYHITASWIATGEVRQYNRRAGIFNKVPVARSVNQNGWGAWEFSTRYSHLDLSEQAIEGGDMDIWSIGANWWLTPYMNVNANYRYIILEKNGATGNSHGLNTRISLFLE